MIKWFRQLIRWHKTPVHNMLEENKWKRIKQLYTPLFDDFEKKTTLKELGKHKQIPNDTFKFPNYKLEPKEY